DHVETSAQFLRPTDIAMSKANPTKAREKLGWQARYTMPEIVQMMVESQLELGG
ncbi:MAG: GDP-mannose 4,6-dehydratase, partial [Cyanobacteriota bacterium]